MPPPAPADARPAKRAGRGARADRLAARFEVAQRERAGRERFAQAVGGEALRDPREKGERGLTRPAVRHRDAARERARDAVLAGKLPDEGGVDRIVGVEDLDVVEGDALGQASAEDFANLVLLADRPQERRAGGPGRPGGGLVDGQDVEPVAGEPLEHAPLELRELRVGRQEIPRGRIGRRLRPRGASEHVEAVDVPAGREGLGVADEDLPQLRGLPPVGECRDRYPGGGDAGRAQLLERPLHRAVEPGPGAQGAEVGLGTEGLRTGVLDESEGLRPGEQPEPLPRQFRSDRVQRERSDGGNAQVHPGAPLAGEAFDDGVADQKRRRDEDLLFQRRLGADGRERGDQPRRRACRFRTRLGLAERKEGLLDLSPHEPSPFLSQTADRRCPARIGSRLRTETGEPTLLDPRGRLRVRRSIPGAGDPANLMRVMPP